jgi:hypothetical protein
MVPTRGQEKMSTTPDFTKKKRIRKESPKSLLSRLMKEMAEPRVAKSAQKAELNPAMRGS